MGGSKPLSHTGDPPTSPRSRPSILGQKSPWEFDSPSGPRFASRRVPVTFTLFSRHSSYFVPRFRVKRKSRYATTDQKRLFCQWALQAVGRITRP